MRKIIMLLFFVLNMNLAFADDPYCTNLSFEMGNFTNWRGFTWVNSTEEGIEKFAREEYYMKRDSEEIFIIEYEDSLKAKKDE